MARKPTGIASRGGRDRFLVVCDDGTVWHLTITSGTAEWTQIEDLPLPGSIADGQEESEESIERKVRGAVIQLCSLGSRVSKKEIRKFIFGDPLPGPKPLENQVTTVISRMVENGELESLWRKDRTKIGLYRRLK